MQDPFPQPLLGEPSRRRVAEQILGAFADEAQPQRLRVALPHDRVQPGDGRLQPGHAGVGPRRLLLPALADVDDASAHQAPGGVRKPQEGDLTRNVGAVRAPVRPFETGVLAGQGPLQELGRRLLRRPSVRLHRGAELHRPHLQQVGPAHPEQLLRGPVDRDEVLRVEVEDHDRVRRVLDQSPVAGEFHTGADRRLVPLPPDGRLYAGGVHAVLPRNSARRTDAGSATPVGRPAMPPLPYVVRYGHPGGRSTSRRVLPHGTLRTAAERRSR